MVISGTAGGYYYRARLLSYYISYRALLILLHPLSCCSVSLAVSAEIAISVYRVRSTRRVYSILLYSFTLLLSYSHSPANLC